MVKATVDTNVKIVTRIVEEEVVEKTVNLQLTTEEAAFIMILVGKCSGDGEYIKMAENIYYSLTKLQKTGKYSSVFCSNFFDNHNGSQPKLYLSDVISDNFRKVAGDF